MKKIFFNDPQNEDSWTKFEEAVAELAKIHNISLATDSASELVHVVLCWPFSRNFSGITEEFVVDKNLWKEARKILQSNEIYFGEIEGKHSEIYGNLEDTDITENTSPNAVSEWIKKNGRYKKERHSFVGTLLDHLDSGSEESKVLQKLLDSVK